MSESFDLEHPEYFTAGTVGPPGQRVFYLQGRENATLVTLKVEKEQVGALGEYLSGLLTRLPGGSPAAAPQVMLVEPVTPAWDVGALGVGYDESADRIVIIANEAVEREEADEESAETPEHDAPGETPGTEGATARFHVTRAQAAAFVERARELIKGGRPICRVCNQPMDPGGHLCPRRNGHPH